MPYEIPWGLNQNLCPSVLNDVRTRHATSIKPRPTSTGRSGRVGDTEFIPTQPQVEQEWVTQTHKNDGLNRNPEDRHSQGWQ